MPPSGPLTDTDIEAIRQWVQLGAPFGGDEDELTEVAPAGDAFEITAADRAWWSVRPLMRPDVPAVANTDWPLNPIDNFLLVRMEAAGLEPPPTADRRALIRRATYDLTGLPPTAEEVEAFENDRRPDAWERLIDRLLDSPHYGERWGRHWLDLVRYAETDGYERDRKKPSAWRYRDWVIDALNADMPYNEFLTHQLAGDEIHHPTAASIIATGYLRLGIWDDEPTDTALAQYDDLDSILDTTSRVMLGMSIGCARCHNHRGDPIPQTDYYRMLSFFRGIAPYKVGGGNQPTPENYADRIPADLGATETEAALARWREKRRDLLAAVRRRETAFLATVEADELATAVEAADRGLAAHLPLDDDLALVAADRRQRFHGRIEDAAVGADGIIGAAYAFDGEDDSIRMPRPVSDDFAISLWFRSRADAPGSVLFDWRNGSILVHALETGSGFGMSIVGDGYVVAGVADGKEGPTNLASGPGYNDGAWHHAVFARGLDGALALHVDGALVAQSEGPTAELAYPEVVEIGWRGPTRGQHFQGALDDLRFYDRALTRPEIIGLYLGTASGGAGLQLGGPPPGQGEGLQEGRGQAAGADETRTHLSGSPAREGDRPRGAANPRPHPRQSARSGRTRRTRLPPHPGQRGSGARDNGGGLRHHRPPSCPGALDRGRRQSAHFTG